MRLVRAFWRKSWYEGPQWTKTGQNKCIRAAAGFCLRGSYSCPVLVSVVVVGCVPGLATSYQPPLPLCLQNRHGRRRSGRPTSAARCWYWGRRNCDSSRLQPCKSIEFARLATGNSNSLIAGVSGPRPRGAPERAPGPRAPLCWSRWWSMQELGLCSSGLPGRLALGSASWFCPTAHRQ